MITDVCLECGLDFQLDCFHFDCTGKFICSREAFDLLIGTDRFYRTQIPCDASHAYNDPCYSCRAAV